MKIGSEALCCFDKSSTNVRTFKSLNNLDWLLSFPLSFMLLDFILESNMAMKEHGLFMFSMIGYTERDMCLFYQEFQCHLLCYPITDFLRAHR